MPHLLLFIIIEAISRSLMSTVDGRRKWRPDALKTSLGVLVPVTGQVLGEFHHHSKMVSENASSLCTIIIIPFGAKMSAYCPSVHRPWYPKSQSYTQGYLKMPSGFCPQTTLLPRLLNLSGDNRSCAVVSR